MRNTKLNRKLETCVCEYCKQPYQTLSKRIKWNKKQGRKSYCSRRCVGLDSKNNIGDSRKNYDISRFCSNKLDGYTKFRYHFRNIQKRQQDVDITIEDLKEQWDLQNGICEFTGTQLILSTYTKIIKNPIYTASLDRKDNSKGYVKGNIRWVSRPINYMKNDMSDDMLWEICRLITKNLIKKGI